MKRSVIITAILVLAAAAGAYAQYVSFVASFGAPRNWNVPAPVAEVVYHDYYDYDWVHATRNFRHGQWFYNVILQRGNHFLEVNIGSHGYVRRVRSFDHYPLAGHVCGAHCGFHSYFYESFHAGCSSPYHHGHNHLVFRPRPVQYVWGHYYQYPSYNKVIYNTTVIKNGPVHKKGNHHVRDNNERHRDNRYSRHNAYPERRRSDMREVQEIRKQRDSRYGREDNSRRGRR